MYVSSTPSVGFESMYHPGAPTPFLLKKLPRSARQSSHFYLTDQNTVYSCKGDWEMGCFLSSNVLS